MGVSAVKSVAAHVLKIEIINCISQYICWNSKLLTSVVYFAKPLKTNLWAVWAEHHAQYIRFLPQTRQKENKCTTT